MVCKNLLDELLTAWFGAFLLPLNQMCSFQFDIISVSVIQLKLLTRHFQTENP